MPLGTEVGLGPRNFVLEGNLAHPRKGHSSPLFSAHVYCGHGRPSQLLLRTCYYCVYRKPCRRRIRKEAEIELKDNYVLNKSPHADTTDYILADHELSASCYLYRVSNPGLLFSHGAVAVFPNSLSLINLLTAFSTR